MKCRTDTRAQMMRINAEKVNAITAVPALAVFL